MAAGIENFRKCWKVPGQCSHILYEVVSCFSQLHPTIEHGGKNGAVEGEKRTTSTESTTSVIFLLLTAASQICSHKVE